MFLYNRNLSKSLGDLSPFEVLTGCSPSYEKFRVFGCKSFPCLREYRSNKFNNKFVSCIFLGYLKCNDGYICYNPVSHKIYISRDLKFLEEDFSLNKALGGKQMEAAARLSNNTLGVLPIQVWAHNNDPPAHSTLAASQVGDHQAHSTPAASRVGDSLAQSSRQQVGLGIQAQFKITFRRASPKWKLRKSI